jgi:hypothetical protein
MPTKSLKIEWVFDPYFTEKCSAELRSMLSSRVKEWLNEIHSGIRSHFAKHASQNTMSTCQGLNAVATVNNLPVSCVGLLQCARDPSGPFQCQVYVGVSPWIQAKAERIGRFLAEQVEGEPEEHDILLQNSQRDFSKEPHASAGDIYGSGQYIFEQDPQKVKRVLGMISLEHESWDVSALFIKNVSEKITEIWGVFSNGGPRLDPEDVAYPFYIAANLGEVLARDTQPSHTLFLKYSVGDQIWRPKSP